MAIMFPDLLHINGPKLQLTWNIAGKRRKRQVVTTQMLNVWISWCYTLSAVNL